MTYVHSVLKSALSTRCARRRCRATSPSTSAPIHHGLAASNPSPPTRPAGSWPAEPPASDTPSNAPTPTALTALPTKTQSSERRIALPTPCPPSLEQHRSQQRQEHEAAGESRQDNGYIFTRPNGAPIEGATLTRHFTTLLHRAGLRRIRFHDLRHSTATLLLEQGVELVVIKEVLGKAHISVTATVYAHVRLRLQRDAIDTLSTALHRDPADGHDTPRRRSPAPRQSRRPPTLPSTTAVKPYRNAHKERSLVGIPAFPCHRQAAVFDV